MRLSSVGLEHLKSVEGFSAKAYWDRTNYAIGYGHNGPDVRGGDVITKVYGERLLKQDVSLFENCISQAVLVPLKQHEFDCLVSFAYNIGCGAFRRSSLLKKLNQGKYDTVPRELMRWRKPSEIIGRRRKEAALWSRPSRPRAAFLMGKSMKRLAVIVGHNERSQGAVCQHAPLTGISEWAYNTDVASAMVRLGDEHGLDVRVFYRDAHLSYSRQIAKVYKQEVDPWGADLSIELHFNGATSSQTRYSVTLSSGSDASLRFARRAQAAMARVFKRRANEDRGVITRARAERGGWSLRAGKSPAILVEPFFGSNQQDCRLAAKPGLKEAYARALLEASAETLGVLPRKHLAASRTIRAGAAIGLAQLGSTLLETSDDLGLAVQYLPVLETAIGFVTVIGVAIIVYARIDDWRKERR